MGKTTADSLIWALACKECGQEVADKLDWSIENGRLIGRNKKGEWKIRIFL